MAYHEGQDLWYGRVWKQEVGQRAVDLITSYAIIGQEGAAVSVKGNTFLDKWYEIPNACPHITILVNKEYEIKHIGPMMKRAEHVQWQITNNSLIKV